MVSCTALAVWMSAPGVRSRGFLSGLAQMLDDVSACVLGEAAEAPPVGVDLGEEGEVTRTTTGEEPVECVEDDVKFVFG